MPMGFLSGNPRRVLARGKEWSGLCFVEKGSQQEALAVLEPAAHTSLTSNLFVRGMGLGS